MRLGELFDADYGSRLSCQILTGPQTDGLVISLAANSVQQRPVLTDDGKRIEGHLTLCEQPDATLPERVQ